MPRDRSPRGNIWGSINLWSHLLRDKQIVYKTIEQIGIFYRLIIIRYSTFLPFHLISSNVVCAYMYKEKKNHRERSGYGWNGNPVEFTARWRRKKLANFPAQDDCNYSKRQCSSSNRLSALTVDVTTVINPFKERLAAFNGRQHAIVAVTRFEKSVTER